MSGKISVAGQIISWTANSKLLWWPTLNYQYHIMTMLEEMCWVLMQPSYELQFHMMHQYFLGFGPSTNEIRFSRCRSNENRDFLGWKINGACFLRCKMKWSFQYTKSSDTFYFSTKEALHIWLITLTQPSTLYSIDHCLAVVYRAVQW